MNESPGCLDSGRESTLEAALPVRRAAFKALRSGRRVSFKEVSSATGIRLKTVGERGRDVASVGMAEIADETFIAMDGLTTRPTQHRIILAGVQLHT
jgi:hypothetical protein